MTLFSTLRERRNWSILQHPIDVQVERLIPLTQVACPVFSGFHAGLRSPQPVEDVVGGPYETVRFIDRQRGSYRPLDPG
jgi:hypothetical protein